MRRSLLPIVLLVAACAGGRPAPGPAGPPPRPRPVFATEGWVKPREARPGCVGEALDAPPHYRGMTAVVRIAVAPDGAVDGFDDASDPPDRSGELTEALGKAIGACTFLPARDPDGRPATTWLILQMQARSRPKLPPDLDD